MIPALLIGRKNSKGFPKKNLYPIGPENDKHPMMTYPLKAARGCKEIDEVFFSSDCNTLKLIAEHLGAKIIDRPKELATDEALADGVFVHGYDYIDGYCFSRAEQIEFMVLLFANAVGITSNMLTDMVGELRVTNADSICTVSPYPAFSPYRMRVKKGKWIRNWESSDSFKGITCDRSSGETPYIYDCSAAVVRPVCLEKITEYGFPPQKWLGQKILYYDKCRDIPCLDIDHSYQVYQMEAWLDKYWKY